MVVEFRPSASSVKVVVGVAGVLGNGSGGGQGGPALGGRETADMLLLLTDFQIVLETTINLSRG